ncbi:DNA cross-link repair 1A protein isoform X2 [Dendrobates tinctorius]|uniref:DNA cross-link repair 1A protein isoform X2 n=1 Tax=Dendrobates tinctorius TaxID=92724 RepID=UPI003CC9E727
MCGNQRKVLPRMCWQRRGGREKSAESTEQRRHLAMSDNEDDIWDYKSLQKQKDRVVDKAECQEQARRSGSQSKRRGNKRRNAPKKTRNTQTVPSTQPAPELAVQGPGSEEDAPSTPKRKKAETVETPTPETPQNRHSSHCPSCQMPFSILLVQTPRWHVSECLDAPSTAQTECPDGFCCSSSFPSHYKRYSHFLLAQRRAVDQLSISPPCTPDLTLPGVDKSSVSSGFIPSISKEMTKLNSPKSQSPSSSQESTRRTSLDMWLSSPSKASQETSNLITADVDPDLCDSAISYSPLVSDQELFSDDEGDVPTSGRTPLPITSPMNNSKAVEIPPQCNTSYRPPRHDNGGSSSVRTHSGEDYWSQCSTPVSGVSEWPPEQLCPAGAADLSSNDQLLIDLIKTEKVAAAGVKFQPCAPIPQHTIEAEPPTSELQERFTQGSQAMTSVPSSKAKKQMDIGVFFGLKPKVVKAAAEVKVPLKVQSLNAVASQNEKPPRKRKATSSLSDSCGVVGNVNEIPVLSTTETEKKGGKRFRQNSTTEQGGRGRKQCPFYKKIPGTGFAVDAFQYGEIDGCSAYFLTHFHSDHYGGLTKKFRFPIYCSKITGNLVQTKLRVEKEFITCLPMYTECLVNGIKVVLLDANHCPGAVLLLFILPNGTTVLHTGDFRAETSMERYPALLGRKIHTLYLDTTYCSPEYTFPPQQETVQFAVNTAFEMVTLHPRTLVVCGTYSIGKEKVFLAIADVLGCKVCMSQDKYKTMQCLESAEIRALVTTDWHSTALHVLPMMQVNFKGLAAHLNKFSGKYDRVLAFKPTGWTYSDGCSSVAEIRPEVRGKITMYGIPYSEHSSFSEMKRFVQFIKPQKIIPTVNVGSWKSRTAMERYFAEWLSESTK